LIEQAYAGAEAAGVAVWGEDEAGPYQTVPMAGQSWAPLGKARCQPHEYERTGTAKLLTRFRPATGQVRAKGVTSAANAVLHPWLRAELERVLADLPAVTTPEADRPAVAQWQTWEGHPCPDLPPLRLILVWDNLAGHLSPELVIWLSHHGVLPLSTPLYSLERELAQHDGVTAAHPRPSGALGPASADPRADHHLAGGDRGRLERRPHALYLAWQAL